MGKRGYPKPRKYYPQNGEKYVGDSYPIIRSSLEKKFFRLCDRNDAVIEWASECLEIPYKNPIDNRYHRYYPDVFLKMNKDGTVKYYLVEIKPQKRVKPPKKRGRKKKTYIREARRYMKNRAKWNAAKAWCERRSKPNRPIIFRIVTDENLGLGG